ncbi:MAG TPA: S9 family peptidase [Gemmatimonadales bacterium]|jgi:dipeptidyl-peptidase 4|nr:S9 family peptidase [Gemmatimonadales bacterium]
MNRNRSLGYALLLAALSALLAPRSVAAQVPAATTAALQQIFASRYYAPERFGPARWIENGAAYSTLERSATTKGGFDIVRYDAKTGARSVLIAAAALVPAGDTTPLAIDNYTWSPDTRQLMIFTNTKQVWRQNTRGDYWVLDRTSGALRQLGGAGAPASTMMYAKFSPQGDRVAFVRKGDIYVERLADGTITRLTTGADSLHVNGMSDWVYEEEFGIRDGFRWSPDGARIAFWHFDMTGVGTFLMINNTDSTYPFTIPIQYPKAGTTNSAVTAGVVSATGGPTTWLRLPGDPREDYIPFMEWAGPDSVLVQRMNRLQNTDALILASAATGGTRTITTETDQAWLDVVDEIPWLKGNREFLWLSERDGWRHVYAVSRSTGAARLLTPGAYDANGIAAVDEKGGWLYFTASPDNATQQYLWRTRLDGKGKVERITPAGEAGTHRYNVSPDARWAIHSWSTFDTPPVTELVSLPGHAVARVLAANTELAAKVKAAVTPGEFFHVTIADGSTLDGWMLKPRDFDPTKRYPMLMYVYGEPAGQTVLDSWGGGTRLWHQALADQGYLVASVDNMGTPAPKGRAWRKAVYEQIGVLSSMQQAQAVQALARTRPYVDSTRVGIWGWSGGGSSTLQAMFRYPEVYQVGMSVAPVPDERLYDTIYQERYMGLPGPNAAKYDSASAIYQAKGLKGHLLLVHGSGDDNVHFQGSQRMLNQLVVLNKSVDFMEYPNRSHCICEGQGTTLHVYSLLTRYLMQNLPVEPRYSPIP